jgi:acyl-CoA thioesterase-1
MKTKKFIGRLVPVLFMCLIGCDSGKPVQSDSQTKDAARPVAADHAAVSPATQQATVPRVVFLGDSLTAGLGLEAEETFPAVVGQLLREQGQAIQVINAGVSGDTTAGGLRRLDWVLKQSPSRRGGLRRQRWVARPFARCL